MVPLLRATTRCGFAYYRGGMSEVYALDLWSNNQLRSRFSPRLWLGGCSELVRSSTVRALMPGGGGDIRYVTSGHRIFFRSDGVYMLEYVHG